MRVGTPVLVAILVVWCMAHYAGIVYGTQQLPLHMSYIGDEQAPVNGALHMLEDKSLLGLRNEKNLYYGPVWAVLALPAVVADFGLRYVVRTLHSALDYKNTILWDWGGIELGLRLIATLFSVLTLVCVYKLLLLKSLNSTRRVDYALLGTSLVAVNYYFFEYSHFFKHWSFVLLALIGQLYVALRMYESKGGTRVDWWVHGALTITSFGVSYVSALYFIAFVPLTWYLWRNGVSGVRTRMYWYALLVSSGFTLVVWWHPYAFMRIVGLLGVGPMAGNLNNIQNPFLAVTSSWGYYFTEIGLNQSFIVVIFLLLVYPVVIRHVIVHVRWLYMFLSVAAANVILFAPASHAEGRYMLPTIVLLVLAAWILFVAYLNDPLRKRWVIITVTVLFVVYAGFHLVHIGQWINVYSRGPSEQVMIADVLNVQDTIDTPVALVQSYIAGRVHTKESYEAYIEKRGRQDTNLYRAILATPLPDGVEPLNVRYIWPSEYETDPHVIDAYEAVYRMDIPRPDELNQFDYMDENLLRLWYYDQYMPSYVRIK